MTRRLLSAFVLVLVIGSQSFAEETVWPPSLKAAKNGTVKLKSKRFLHVPPPVQEARNAEGAAPFTVAKVPPTVELAFHRDLGTDAVNRRLWSSWGDICLASDGSVYCAIGDHGNAVGGDARCFIYRWDPKAKTLKQIVDMNRVVPLAEGQPAWSKVHAKIDEGVDGKIYFCCTLNDGNRGVLPTYKWTKQLPGGQIYQYDPASGKTAVYANLPPRRCTATSILDRRRNIWWCNLEGGENQLWGINLSTKKVVYQAPPGSMHFNRNFALADDGSIFFNGKEGIWKLDPKTKKLTKTKSSFPDSPGMRCSTRQMKNGDIYGITHGSKRIFRYSTANDELTMLQPCWLTGGYTTVCVLSSDERFMYYLPGAHGRAFQGGTPVIQYEIATGRLKVLAFLAEAFEKKYGYVPCGTYGIKLSADDSTLYVNFNGHAADSQRPERMRANGFGLTSFAAIHIPKSER